MHRLLTTLGRGFKEKIGWKRLGIVASLLIIVFAITTLVRTLKGVDTAVILVALTEIAPHRIALAALCVVGASCSGSAWPGTPTRRRPWTCCRRP